MADLRIPASGNPNPHIPGADSWNGLAGGEGNFENEIDIVVDPDTGQTIISLGEDLEEDEDTNDNFDENLCEKISNLAGISSDLIQGIEADEASQSQWVENYTRGMDFLGLKIEDRTQAVQRKNCSTITHPLLLWAVVNGQSMARAEMLPSDGPCKVKNDGVQNSPRNDLADQLEQDMNHYLTTTATEFYPDTDRGLFYLYYGGTIYKKLYHCPLRERPVSECVYMPDLIVSNDATDLENAVRVTHRINMTKSMMARMKLSGYYRKDATFTQPNLEPTSIAAKEADVSGRAAAPQRQEDQPFTIYECYTELDLSDYDHYEKGQPDGLPLPYRVSIDKDSLEVLEVRRNWKEGDEKFRKRKRFVKYGLVPGMGFLDLGYLHLLGNHTRALTGIWRIMVDAGMFSNFPGGARVKGVRLATNEIQPGPGEWVEIDTGPMDDIRKALMPLPYKGPTAELMSLAQAIEQEGKQIAGTVTIDVGEGKANVPVGSVISLIEQQTQTMAAVHKRLHQAQEEELGLLKELFEEDPESLTKGIDNPVHKWTSEELADATLVPASDPNVPAHMHRIMQGTALSMLAQQNATLYNQYAVQKRLLKTIRIGDIEELLHEPPPPGQGPPDPNALAAQVAAKEVEARNKEVMVRAADTQAKAQIAAKKASIDEQGLALKAKDIQTRHEVGMANATAKLVTDKARLDNENANKERDRAIDLHKTTEAEKTQRLGHTLGHIAAMKPPEPKPTAKPKGKKEK